MKRALVTGASGFLGSFVVKHLVGAGVAVAVLTRPTADLGRLGNTADRVASIVGDLEQPDSFRAAAQSFAPDTVFHLAWHGVATRHHQELAQVERNLAGTLALVELAAGIGARTWIGAGCQAEYAPPQGPVDESAPTRPSTLYGAAKLAAGHLAARVAAVHALRFAWLRVFPTYGPRDHPESILPSIVHALGRRECPTLTSGEQRWDYLHVEDVAAAFHAIAATPDAAGIFNVGSGHAPRWRQIVEILRDAVDPGLPLEFGEIPSGADHVMFLQAEIDRLQAATNWVPRRTLREGLRETAAWFLAHPSGPSA